MPGRTRNAEPLSVQDPGASRDPDGSPQGHGLATRRRNDSLDAWTKPNERAPLAPTPPSSRAQRNNAMWRHVDQCALPAFDSLRLRSRRSRTGRAANSLTGPVWQTFRNPRPQGINAAVYQAESTSSHALIRVRPRRRTSGSVLIGAASRASGCAGRRRKPSHRRVPNVPLKGLAAPRLPYASLAGLPKPVPARLLGCVEYSGNT